MTIQEKLFSIIDKRGVKCSAISGATGIPETNLSKSKQGNRKLTIDEFFSICRFLEVSADTFI